MVPPRRCAAPAEARALQAPGPLPATPSPRGGAHAGPREPSPPASRVAHGRRLPGRARSPGAEAPRFFRSGRCAHPSFSCPESPDGEMPLRRAADSQGAARADTGTESTVPRRPGFVYTRTPVPSSTPVYRHSARERFARPAPPTPGKETDAISIADYQMFLARLSPPRPPYSRSPNPPPRLPPYPRPPPSSFFFLLLMQISHKTCRSGAAGPGWFPSPPLLPPPTGGCGSALGGHEAPAPRPSPAPRRAATPARAGAGGGGGSHRPVSAASPGSR
ncbi:unnamed protein product [Nyctereutes procyonoides]|uniref:(raccoon dog) hypothetical protein n=1 Tax=Nyctereutes procyonoides TaxID=34880 RepID=A0A811Y988_NYCPR|nr:unnamed protein product [Nyctereutes procyonoides]